jgi:uncharacterized membrane protein YphA (DoxX/SURF4 family)
VRFVHDVQLELGACLANDEWEVGYRMEEFVALMARKSANRAATLRLVRKRYEVARRQRFFAAIPVGLLGVPVVAGIVGVVGGLLVWLGVAERMSKWTVAVFALVLWLPLVASVATFGWRDAEYHRRLLRKLEPPAS